MKSNSSQSQTLQCFEVDCFDPEALSQTVTDADVEIEQRKPGAFHAQIKAMLMPDAELVIGTLNRSYHLRGCYPKDVTIFSFWFPETDPMSVRGINFNPADTLVIGKNEAETELLCHGQNAYGTFAIPTPTLEALAASVFQTDTQQFDAGVSILPNSGPWLSPLRLMILEYQEAIQRLTQQAHNESAQRPEVQVQRQAQAQVMARCFQKKLTDSFISLLLERGTTNQQQHTPTAHHRRKILRKSDEFIRSHVEHKFSLLELCQAVGVSKRSLQYAFQENYDMTPRAYLKTLRLNQARRDLMQGNPNTTSVTTIAFKHGCFHLGRFALEYAKHFGEKPSETLQKRSKQALATTPYRGGG